MTLTSSPVGSTWQAAYARSLEDPDAFWLEAAAALEWTTFPRQARDAEGRWFPDGVINTCDAALDRHLRAGRGAETALIYDSPVTGTKRRFDFAELTDRVASLAGALRAAGVEAGDRVLIYMPMVPEAAMAMLACARIGAVHAVVFGGFGAPELASRIESAEPKVMLTASCGIEPGRVVEYLPLVGEALLAAAHEVAEVVVLERPQSEVPTPPGWHSWESFVANAAPADPRPMRATDPLYVLYTSGTTGLPKGIVRDTGGHAVALAWTMGAIYDCGPGDVFWAASDIGWVVGHSYMIYGPLLAGCATVVYEGKPVGTPDAGALWRVAAEHRVRILFTAPTAIRAVRREDPTAALLAEHDLTNLRALFLAGEKLDPDTWAWTKDALGGRPVVDHWWQTETGWPIAANCLGLGELPMRAGSPTRPVPGFDLRVLGPDGTELGPGEDGQLALRLPLPPGSLVDLWRAPGRLRTEYLEPFPGYYATGDAGVIDSDGYPFVLGRVDDVINVAGHRLSTSRIEEILTRHPDVGEAAVFGVPDPLRGQVPAAFVVLVAGAKGDALEEDLIEAVRLDLGPIACFKRVRAIPQLPKTRSGKVLRAYLRGRAEGRAMTPPPTIEDITVLAAIEPALAELTAIR